MHTHTLYVQLCNRCIYSIVEFFSFFNTLSAGSLLAGEGVGRELQDFWWLVGQGPYCGLAPNSWVLPAVSQGGLTQSHVVGDGQRCG